MSMNMIDPHFLEQFNCNPGNTSNTGISKFKRMHIALDFTVDQNKWSNCSILSVP